MVRGRRHPADRAAGNDENDWAGFRGTGTDEVEDLLRSDTRKREVEHDDRVGLLAKLFERQPAVRHGIREHAGIEKTFGKLLANSGVCICDQNALTAVRLLAAAGRKGEAEAFLRRFAWSSEGARGQAERALENVG